MAVAQRALSTVGDSRLSAGGRTGGALRLGIGLAIAAWAALAAMWVSGSADRFGHDQEGASLFVAAAFFLVGWLAMVAAMMLPSSLPTLAALDRVHTWGGDRATWFMAGYFLVWAAFGAAAFLGDQILHGVVAAIPWLSEREFLVTGGVAVFAGTAELLGRTPPPLVPAAASGPFAVGGGHAVDRIRRCWPLMLFATAVGMHALWMVGLTCAMALEVHPRARVALRFVGVAILALGAAVIAEPSWAPLLGGS